MDFLCYSILDSHEYLVSVLAFAPKKEEDEQWFLMQPHRCRFNVELSDSTGIITASVWRPSQIHVLNHMRILQGKHARGVEYFVTYEYTPRKVALCLFNNNAFYDIGEIMKPQSIFCLTSNLQPFQRSNAKMKSKLKHPPKTVMEKKMQLLLRKLPWKKMHLLRQMPPRNMLTIPRSHVLRRTKKTDLGQPSALFDELFLSEIASYLKQSYVCFGTSRSFIILKIQTQ